MTAFLKFDAIKKGESKAPGHEGDKGWIEINNVAWDFGRKVVTQVGTSSKREPAAPYVGPITLSKYFDSTSVLLAQEGLLGLGCNAQIDLVKTGKKGLETYLELKLTNAIIAHYHVSAFGGEDGQRPQETMTLNFTKIEIKYTPSNDQGQRGSSVATSYDLTKAA